MDSVASIPALLWRHEQTQTATPHSHPPSRFSHAISRRSSMYLAACFCSISIYSEFIDLTSPRARSFSFKCIPRIPIHDLIFLVSRPLTLSEHKPIYYFVNKFHFRLFATHLSPTLLLRDAAQARKWVNRSVVDQHLFPSF